jgi:hypothetical protein
MRALAPKKLKTISKKNRKMKKPKEMPGIPRAQKSRGRNL